MKLSVIFYFFFILNFCNSAVIMPKFDRERDPPSTFKEVSKEPLMPIAEKLPGFWERLFSGDHKNQRAKPVFRN